MSEVLVTFPDGTMGEKAVITLNRPDSLNSLNKVVLKQIRQAAQELSGRPLKVVVVRGNGRAFCAGADFNLLQGNEGNPMEMGELGRTMAEALEAIPAVTIAALHGPVIGGGIVVAACCDLRVAAEDTYFAIPEIDVGLPLGWAGVPRLVREIGPVLTRELVLTCRPFTAAEAKQAGFVNRVVATQELDQEVNKLVDTLCAKPAFALLSTNKAISQVITGVASSYGRVGDSREQELAYQDEQSSQAMKNYLESKSKPI